MINALRSPLVLGLALSLFAITPTLGCDGGDEGGAEEMGTTTDTDPTTTSGDGDGDATTTGGECFNQPDLCAQFVRCIGALVPGQAEQVEAQYGEMGSCWCGSTEDEAQTCYETCFEQVETAIKNNPTVAECHENYCTIDELDTTQPYGPINGGSCDDFIGEQGDPIAQQPVDAPFGLPGGYCAPACSGLANYCPDHTQTTADGTCYLQLGDTAYCAARCWVDPTIVGGTQCPCGATCQPQGAPDGEGNMRGLCTFE